MLIRTCEQMRLQKYLHQYKNICMFAKLSSSQVQSTEKLTTATRTCRAKMFLIIIEIQVLRYISLRYVCIHLFMNINIECTVAYSIRKLLSRFQWQTATATETKLLQQNWIKYFNGMYWNKCKYIYTYMHSYIPIVHRWRFTYFMSDDSNCSWVYH